MSIGIYMIKNLSNNKVYIGQSTNINRRWKDHKTELRNNIHHNKHLQKSYNKYGEKSFQYLILCETSKEKLNELESYYIQKYQSHDSKYGYNQTLGGDSNIVFTKDTIKKMRSSHEYEFVPILQYTLDKKFVSKFNSLSEASRHVNGTPSRIRNCANKFSIDIGVSKTYKGYFWIYEYDVEKFEQIDIDEYLYTETSFPVNKYEYPSGKFICSYKTVLNAATNNNVSIDVISMCVREVQKQSNGFTYRNANYFTQNKLRIKQKTSNRKKKRPVVAFNKSDNTFAMYIDNMEQLKEQGLHSGHICECCNGKRKSYKGYMLMYLCVLSRMEKRCTLHAGKKGTKE